MRDIKYEIVRYQGFVYGGKFMKCEDALNEAIKKGYVGIEKEEVYENTEYCSYIYNKIKYKGQNEPIVYEKNIDGTSKIEMVNFFSVVFVIYIIILIIYYFLLRRKYKKNKFL